MKKKIILFVACVSFFVFGYLKYIDIEKAETEGEFYIYNGKRYIDVAGKCIKSQLVAKTDNGISLYGIKNDPQHYFLLDSFGKLYIWENYNKKNNDITGIFLEGKYYEDKKLIELFSKLELEILGVNLGVLESKITYQCQVYNTSESKSIYLCYDNIKASSKILGYIEHQKQGYMYIDISLIKNIPFNGKTCYEGIKISSDFDEMLDEYFYKG